jgi:hypothetical protein
MRVHYARIVASGPRSSVQPPSSGSAGVEPLRQVQQNKLRRASAFFLNGSNRPAAMRTRSVDPGFGVRGFCFPPAALSWKVCGVHPKGETGKIGTVTSAAHEAPSLRPTAMQHSQTVNASPQSAPALPTPKCPIPPLRSKAQQEAQTGNTTMTKQTHRAPTNSNQNTYTVRSNRRAEPAPPSPLEKSPKIRLPLGHFGTLGASENTTPTQPIRNRGKAWHGE